MDKEGLGGVANGKVVVGEGEERDHGEGKRERRVLSRAKREITRGWNSRQRGRIKKESNKKEKKESHIKESRVVSTNIVNIKNVTLNRYPLPY